jgi:hypothetical protein
MEQDFSIGPARKLQLAKNEAFAVADEYLETNWPLDTDEKFSQFEVLEALAETANGEFLEFIRAKGPVGH